MVNVLAPTPVPSEARVGQYLVAGEHARQEVIDILRMAYLGIADFFGMRCLVLRR